jgi:hypothetical protein
MKCRESLFRLDHFHSVILIAAGLPVWIGLCWYFIMAFNLDSINSVQRFVLSLFLLMHPILYGIGCLYSLYIWLCLYFMLYFLHVLRAIFSVHLISLNVLSIGTFPMWYGSVFVAVL